VTWAVLPSREHEAREHERSLGGVRGRRVIVEAVVASGLHRCGANRLARAIRGELVREVGVRWLTMSGSGVNGRRAGRAAAHGGRPTVGAVGAVRRLRVRGGDRPGLPDVGKVEPVLRGGL
jgi:hypothetical protein